MAVRLPRLEAIAPSPGFLQLQWQKLCRLIEDEFAARDLTLANQAAQIGSLETGYSVAEKSATYTEEAVRGAKIIKASGTFTINLPTAVGNGCRFTVKLVSAGTVTIDAAGSETIDGAATTSLNIVNESLNLVSDGTNWILV